MGNVSEDECREISGGLRKSFWYFVGTLFVAFIVLVVAVGGSTSDHFKEDVRQTSAIAVHTSEIKENKMDVKENKTDIKEGFARMDTKQRQILDAISELDR